MTKQLALWVECPGVASDGKSGHAMRDFCSNCSPFWEKYPICPNDGKSLSQTGYCKFCMKHYDVSTNAPAITTREEISKLREYWNASITGQLAKKEVKTLSVSKEFDEALTAWMGRAQEVINKYWKNMNFTFSPPPVLSIDQNGKKFIRIVRDDHSQRSVHCFIEKETGDVLMAAGWKAPAKHARGNIYTIGKEGVTAQGAKYL